MTPEQFIYWVKGYLAGQEDCQIKTDIEKAITTITEKNIPYVGYRTTENTNSTARIPLHD